MNAGYRRCALSPLLSLRCFALHQLHEFIKVFGEDSAGNGAFRKQAHHGGLAQKIGGEARVFGPPGLFDAEAPKVFDDEVLRIGGQHHIAHIDLGDFFELHFLQFIGRTVVFCSAVAAHHIFGGEPVHGGGVPLAAGDIGEAGGFVAELRGLGVGVEAIEEFLHRFGLAGDFESLGIYLGEGNHLGGFGTVDKGVGIEVAGTIRFRFSVDHFSFQRADGFLLFLRKGGDIGEAVLQSSTGCVGYRLTSHKVLDHLSVPGATIDAGASRYSTSAARGEDGDYGRRVVRRLGCCCCGGGRHGCCCAADSRDIDGEDILWVIGVGDIDFVDDAIGITVDEFDGPDSVGRLRGKSEDGVRRPTIQEVEDRLRVLSQRKAALGDGSSAGEHEQRGIECGGEDGIAGETGA